MQIVTKIKLFISTYIEELGVSAVIILVAFSCFYLGRASVAGIGLRDADGITIEQDNLASAFTAKLEPTNSMVGTLVTKGDIVASKNGKRYYYPGCSGIARISPANIVHFTSVSEAEKLGLTLAANCKPNK